MACRRLSRDGFGITACTASCAFSRRTPVGVPASSRSIFPASGSLVATVMLASCKARVFAADFIQIPACGQNFDRPERLVPAFTYYPVRRLSGVALGAQPLAELIKSLRANHVDGHLLQARHDQVQVSVIEAGHDEVTIEIHNIGVWPLQLHNLIARAHGENALAQHGQRLGTLARAQ